SQPLNTALDEKKQLRLTQPEILPEVVAMVEPARAVRRKLQDERRAITHKFDIQGHEGYITVGTYEDGSPGEIFLVMSKEGSTISGLMDAFATAISLAQPRITFQGQEDAPACSDCGSIMIRNGTCYKCLNCGSTSGCS